MFQQKAQHSGIMMVNMKYSGCYSEKWAYKTQSNHSSEEQMSDHPRDLTISGATTRGSHKAKETATQLFFAIKEALQKSCSI